MSAANGRAQPERLEDADRLDDAHGQRRARLDGEGEDDDERGGEGRVAPRRPLRRRSADWLGPSADCGGAPAPCSRWVRPCAQSSRAWASSRAVRIDRLHTTLVGRMRSWYFCAFPPVADESGPLHRQRGRHEREAEDPHPCRREAGHPLRPPHPGEQLRGTRPRPQAPRRRPVRPAPHRGRRPRLHLLRRLPEGVPGGLHRRAPRPLALARQGQGAPLRRHDHARRAALHRPATTAWRPASSTRSCPPSSTRGAPPPRAGTGAQDAAALQRPRPLQRLRRVGRREPGASARSKSHYVVSGATGCLEVSTTRYPFTAWKGSYIHTNFENAAATLSGVETAFRALLQARQARGPRQVHRLRRRRRHLRHRPAGALRRHGARPRHALRVLRQRRLHEHRLPALERDAARRLDDHEPGRLGAARASSATARTSPRSWWPTACPTWPSPRRTTRRTSSTRRPRRWRSRAPPSSTCSPPARAAGAPTTTRAST